MSSVRAGQMGRPVSLASAEARAAFLVRTYGYLFGALLAFTGIEIALFKSGLAEPMARAMLGTSWLLVLGAFVLVSWAASWAAARVESRAVQHLALLGYVLAQALIFVPLLFIAFHQFPGAITSAAAVTILGFAALTGVVYFTRLDFSFLRVFLMFGGIMALVTIVLAVIFKWELGAWFSVAMIVFAAGAILYKTDAIMKTYPEDRYVSAALELFASVALLFWYVLRLFMRRR